MLLLQHQPDLAATIKELLTLTVHVVNMARGLLSVFLKLGILGPSVEEPLPWTVPWTSRSCSCSCHRGPWLLHCALKAWVRNEWSLFFQIVTWFYSWWGLIQQGVANNCWMELLARERSLCPELPFGILISGDFATLHSRNSCHQDLQKPSLRERSQLYLCM